MSVLGIIACEMFEEEIVELMRTDKDVKQVFVVETECSSRLCDKLKKAGVKLASGKLKDFSAETDEFVVVVELKEMALHEKPEILKKEVLESISYMQDYTGAILLLYGLCGNALKKINTLTEDTKVPVLILREKDNGIVDDCIGAALGGTDKYLELLKHYPGTFFLTPMWAEHWREMLQKVHIIKNPYDVKSCKYIFDCVGYRRAMKVDLGIGDEEAFESNVEEFRKLFEFEREDVKGTIEIVRSNYEKAKMLTTGISKPQTKIELQQPKSKNP
jgi:hypothetical protein